MRHQGLSLLALLTVGSGKTVAPTSKSPDDVEDVVGLEVDLLVGGLEGEVPGHPLLPVGLHHLLRGQGDLALDQLQDPHGARVEHGVGVVPAGSLVR